jgi:hypothetical protein
MERDKWRPAFGASLILHALFLFTAIKAGSFQTLSEPKVIEVDLGIRTDAAMQADSNLNAAPPRCKQPAVSRPAEPTRETKRAVTVSVPVQFKLE